MQGPISQRDLLWLHLSCWLRSRPARRLHLLRFEDFKQDPVGRLACVAALLDLAVPDEELYAAAAASDVGHLQLTEAELRRRDPAARQFNRRGCAYEWREVWPPHWHALLGPYWHEPLLRLGYLPPPPLARSAHADFDTDAVLRWRGLDDRDARRRWTRSIQAWLGRERSVEADPA
jgi:hypothetical protein